MVFYYRQRTGPNTPLEDEDQRLYIDGQQIKQVSNFYFLGVWINQDLTWSKQISMLSAKIGKSQGKWEKIPRKKIKKNEEMIDSNEN